MSKNRRLIERIEGIKFGINQTHTRSGRSYLAKNPRRVWYRAFERFKGCGRGDCELAADEERLICGFGDLEMAFAAITAAVRSYPYLSKCVSREVLFKISRTSTSK